MSDRQTTPTAREQWLHVALAVARDGMTQPRDFEVRESSTTTSRVELTFDLLEPADAWADRLGLTRTYQEMVSGDGKRAISTWAGRRADGWWWTVCAYVPLDEPAPAAVELADQVTAAIEVASKVWACPHSGCTYHIADGPVAEGESPTHELIQEHIDIEHDGDYPEDNTRVLGRHPEAGLV